MHGWTARVKLDGRPAFSMRSTRTEASKLAAVRESLRRLDAWTPQLLDCGGTVQVQYHYAPEDVAPHHEDEAFDYFAGDGARWVLSRHTMNFSRLELLPETAVYEQVVSGLQAAAAADQVPA